MKTSYLKTDWPEQLANGAYVYSGIGSKEIDSETLTFADAVGLYKACRRSYYKGFAERQMTGTNERANALISSERARCRTAIDFAKRFISASIQAHRLPELIKIFQK